MLSYNALLNIPYRRFYLLVFMLLCLITFIILSSFVKAHSFYNTYAFSNGESLFIDVPITNSDAVTNGKYLIVKDKRYKYKIINISDIKSSGLNNYQTYQINIDNSFQKNEVLNLTFYYKPEKIIRKVIRIIF